jgi:low affinity Fe/Cu permease
MSMKHPSERGGDERTRFDEIAEAASNFTSSPVFFAICLALVVAWVAGFALGLSSDVRDFLGFAMSALTLLLLALVKNSELRADYAVQRKLDAIAEALLQQRRGDNEAAQDELERAIGMHDEV